MSDNNSSNVPTEVLSTDVILYHIFDLLGVQDLLNFRLVNQKWNVVASSVLKSKPTYINGYKLRGVKPGKDHGYAFIDSSVLEQVYRRNFEYLTGQIQNNPNFPFLGFTLDRHFPKVTQETLNSFAQSCGKYFRRLRVGDGVKAKRLPEVLPNFNEIEYLSVGVIYRNRSSTSLTSDDKQKPISLIGAETSFPKLTCLAVSKEYDPYDDEDEDEDGLGIQLCEEIIKASPKLRRMENFKVQLTKTLIDCGKLHTITDFALESPVNVEDFDLWSSWDYPNLASLKLFSENAPPLKSLDIVGFTDSVQTQLRLSQEEKENEEEIRKLEDFTWGSLTRILDRCKDSLTHLRLDYLKEPPTLHNLQSISIVHKRLRECNKRGQGGRNDGPYLVFDMESPWETYFPSLQTVKIELKRCTSDTVWIYFGQCEPYTFPTVSTLELQCPFDVEGIEGLVATFPNVTNLRVHWKEDSGITYGRSRLEYLWRFSPDLKSLEIYDFPVDSEEFERFDESMTGFCHHICQNVRKHPRIPFEQSHLDLFRSSASIIHLENLESFVVHFICSMNLRIEDPNVYPISSWYALELMPNLKTVKFLYDPRGVFAACIAEALKPYEKYVTVLPR